MTPLNDSDIDRLLSEKLRKSLEKRISNKGLESEIFQTIHNTQINKFQWILLRPYINSALLSGFIFIIFLFIFMQSSHLKGTFLSGDCKIQVNGKNRVIRNNIIKLKPSNELNTMGNTVQIALSEKSLLILDQKTSIKYLDSGKLHIQSGRIHYLNEESKEMKWEFNTPLGFIRTIGTEFDLTVLENQILVSVWKGEIEFSDKNNSHRIRTGQKITIDLNQCKISDQMDQQKRWWTPKSNVPWYRVLGQSNSF